MDKYYIGIDAGGTKIAYGLFNSKLEIIAKTKIKSDDTLDGQQYFGLMTDALCDFVKENKVDISKVEGIGIGIAGYVDFDNQIFIMNASLPKLRNFPVVKYMKERLGQNINIVMDNDCHCGALAEYRLGAGRSHRHMLYCPISTGISSGIIIDGKVFRGSNGCSGESGHMLTAIEGRDRILCGCGNYGCFNSLCSGKATAERVKTWIREGEDSIMPSIAGGVENITAEHIHIAYQKGDKLAIKAVDFLVHYMTIWIFDVYMLLNIDCVVFSGGLVSMKDIIFPKLEKQFKEYNKNGFNVEFKATELGSDSGLVGAVQLLF